MKIRIVITAAALAAAVTGQAEAQQTAPTADFELNGSTTNTGLAGALTNNGTTFGISGAATGLIFGANQGPTVTGLGAISAYTIDCSFHFNARVAI